MSSASLIVAVRFRNGQFREWTAPVTAGRRPLQKPEAFADETITKLFGLQLAMSGLDQGIDLNPVTLVTHRPLDRCINTCI